MPKKGNVKKLTYQRERTKYGKMLISDSYSEGMTREEYTEPWNDHYKLGLIYALHKYTPKQKLTMREIGKIIGFGNAAPSYVVKIDLSKR